MKITFKNGNKSPWKTKGEVNYLLPNSCEGGAVNHQNQRAYPKTAQEVPGAQLDTTKEVSAVKQAPGAWNFEGLCRLLADFPWLLAWPERF